VRNAALLLCALAAVAAAAPKPKPTPVYPSRLPAGSQRALAEQKCLVCHSAQLIAQQHKDAAAWEKTIAQMEKWGVALTPAEHDSLKSYLVRALGPRTPAGVAKGPPARP
jgi:hypothetical protein